jgi:two-component system cell cycle response regulator DivK
VAQPRRRDEVDPIDVPKWVNAQRLSRLLRHRGPPIRSHRTPLILIVDDSVDTREMYAQYFRHRDFGAITAPDGDAAIDLAVRTKPDVIVMDLAMPGISGISAAHHLKHDPRTKRIPIVLLTGHGHRAIEHGALEMGIDVFLTKPCLPEELESHVRRLLTPSADSP